MSSTDASSRCAASRLPLSSTVSLATYTALPAVWREREPIVPDPLGTSAVSDCRIVMSSIATPSLSAMIIENAVTWPWPWALVPTRAITFPSLVISTAPNSLWSPAGAVTST